MNEPKNGAELIAAERQRQIEKEGWTPEHDAQHGKGEMVDAAKCYALAAIYQSQISPDAAIIDKVPAGWPWGTEWWKPSDDPVRNLEKAGALIAAEIDRQQRQKERVRDDALLEAEAGLEAAVALIQKYAPKADWPGSSPRKALAIVSAAIKKQNR